MEPRKLLVSQLQKYVNQAEKDTVEPNVDHGQEYYYELETQLTITDFKDLIAELEASEDPNINEDDVIAIEDLLADRWDRVANTDASYVIRPNSVANTLCINVARYIHENLSQFNVEHERKLVMPTVESWTGSLNKDLARNTHLHELLLTDDGKELIEVGTVFNSRSVSRDRRYYTTQYNHSDKRELSEAEKKRVTNHSSLAKKYIDLLDSWDANEIKEAKYQLLENLSLRDYGGHRVESSYGRTGYERLKSNLLDNEFDRLFTNKEQLFSYFAAKEYREEWDEQAMLLSDETLSRLVNPAGDMKSVMSGSASMYTGHPKHDKAVLYFMAETYWRERKKQPKYTGIAGRVAGGYAAYSREDKGEAIKLIKDYITNLSTKEHITKSGWDAFVKKNHAELAGPINDGTVGLITAQFETADEVYKKRLGPVRSIAMEKHTI